MKQTCWNALVLFSIAFATQAQTEPVVSVIAADPVATKNSSDNGAFVISRTGGDYSQPLAVSLAVGGTAIPGFDYQSLSTTATIPANSASVTLPVLPATTSGTSYVSSVILSLQPDPTDAYTLDLAQVATVFIYDPNIPAPAPVASPVGLVSWWRAESNPNDAAGTNNAQLVNGTGFAAGMVGQGFGLNGSTNYIRVPASATLDVGASDGMTLEAWVNPFDIATAQAVFDWSRDPSGAPYGVRLWLGNPENPGYIVADIEDSSGNSHLIDAEKAVVAGEFQHLALTYCRTSGIARLFVNGTIVSEANLGTLLPQTTYDLYFGGRPAGDGYFPFFAGIIDEISLYNRALSTNEILSVFNANKAGKFLDSDGNGLPDAWELQFFGHLGVNPNDDPDGDGLTNLQEYRIGSNPTDYYNGTVPVLTIVSGNSQSGVPSALLPFPLTIGLAASDGSLLVNAPVTFSVTQGGATVAGNRGGPFGSSVELRTDFCGQIAALALMPLSQGATCTIVARVSSGTNTVQATFSASTLQAIGLWLRADAGVTNDSNNFVSTWADQTSNHYNATQTSAPNRPLLVTNSLNGLPVIHFNGSSHYFNLPNVFSGTTQAEALVVLKATTGTPNYYPTLWRMGTCGGNYGLGYPGPSGQIVDDFGSTVPHSIGSPAQPLTQYHVYEVAGQSGSWMAWINGTLLSASSGNAYAVWPQPLGLGVDLSYIAYNHYFAGDIAEVLIFNRTLSAGQRLAVNRYLNGKYGLVSATTSTPTNLSAQAISPTQVSLTWNCSSPQGASISIERKTGSTGSYAEVALVSGSLSFIDTNLTAGTIYWYRIRAIKSTAWSEYSNEALVTTPGSGSGIPLGNLNLWLKADTGLPLIGSNSPVNLWPDQSGQGNNASQTTAANQPQWVPGALNGLPVLHFNGTSHYFNLPNVVSGTTQAEALVVLKVTTNTPSYYPTLWRMGTSGGNYALGYPGPSGQIVDDFGSTAAHNVGVPAQPLTQYHLYEVAGQGGSWEAWINGTLLSSVSNNTFGIWNQSFGLGVDATYIAYNHYFAGDIAEVLIFNRTLSADERVAVNFYLNGKYDLLPAPSTPSNLVARAISPSQVSLTWDWTPSQGASISVERKTGSGGSYAVVAQVSGGFSFVDTNLAANTTYYYRVRALSAISRSFYSNEGQVTTLMSGSDIPLGNLVLWLKADKGLPLIGSNSPVNLWADQCGKGNDATQTTATNQPQWVSRALNGLPVVHFNGTGHYFNLPNILSGTTQSEAMVVLKVTTNTPNYYPTLWRMGTSGCNYALGYPGTNGEIIDDFGSTVAHNVGIPAQPLTQYHLYQVAGAGGSWAAWINGTLLSSVNSNIYAVWNQSFGLGVDATYIAFNHYFAGDVAEVVVFNRILSTEEREAAGSYLSSKYGLAQSAIDGSAPATPTNLLATGISANQIGLTWSRGSTNEIFFQIERKLGSNGDYQLLATLPAGTTSFVDTSINSTNQYFYRVKAFNYFGVSSFSAEISPPAIGITSPLDGSVSNGRFALTASASDADGTIAKVDFFVQGILFATLTSPPYSTDWPPTRAGSWLVQAKATDNQGNSQVSGTVRISVFLDTDGDGFGDYLEVLMGTDPTDPLDPSPPPPNDFTPPMILLDKPTGAILLP